MAITDYGSAFSGGRARAAARAEAKANGEGEWEMVNRKGGRRLGPARSCIVAIVAIAYPTGVVRALWRGSAWRDRGDVLDVG